MKKRKNRKLTLNRETVKNLEANDLSKVAGGETLYHECGQTDPQQACTSTCRCTQLCSVRTCPP